MTDLTEREVDCPRCHEQCGWCSDYRWMHGTMRLPNATGRKRAYCHIPAMKPEGDDCPMCGGSRRVLQAVSYRPVQYAAERGEPWGEQA